MAKQRWFEGDEDFAIRERKEIFNEFLDVFEERKKTTPWRRPFSLSDDRAVTDISWSEFLGILWIFPIQPIIFSGLSIYFFFFVAETIIGLFLSAIPVLIGLWNITRSFPPR